MSDATKNDSCRMHQEAMADALFGEPSLDASERLQVHLDLCAECRAEYESLRKTVEVARLRRRTDPGEAFWDAFHDRVAERAISMLETGETDRHEGRLTPSAAPVYRLSPLRLVASYAPRAVAAALLVAVGFLVGKLVSQPSPNDINDLARIQAPTEAATGGTLVADESELLARSEIVLLQFVNGAADARSSALARELGGRASVVHASLDARGERSMGELIRELEFVLLQIANMDAQSDEPGVELVRDAIDRRALLFRINREQLRTSTAHSQL